MAVSTLGQQNTERAQQPCACRHPMLQHALEEALSITPQWACIHLTSAADGVYCLHVTQVQDELDLSSDSDDE